MLKSANLLLNERLLSKIESEVCREIYISFHSLEYDQNTQINLFLHLYKSPLKSVIMYKKVVKNWLSLHFPEWKTSLLLCPKRMYRFIFTPCINMIDWDVCLLLDRIKCIQISQKFFNPQKLVSPRLSCGKVPLLSSAVERETSGEIACLQPYPLNAAEWAIVEQT